MNPQLNEKRVFWTFVVLILSLIALLLVVYPTRAQEDVTLPDAATVIAPDAGAPDDQLELTNTAITGLFLAGFAVVVAFGSALALVLHALPKMVVLIVQSVLDTVMVQLQAVAARTPTTFDDELLARIDQRLKQMIAARLAQSDENAVG